MVAGARCKHLPPPAHNASPQGCVPYGTFNITDSAANKADDSLISKIIEESSMRAKARRPKTKRAAGFLQRPCADCGQGFRAPPVLGPR